jgi:hypothetical protein
MIHEFLPFKFSTGDSLGIQHEKMIQSLRTIAYIHGFIWQEGELGKHKIRLRVKS